MVGPSRTASAASTRSSAPIFAGLTFILVLDDSLAQQAEAAINNHGGRCVGGRSAHTATHAVVPMNYGTRHCPHQQLAEDAPCQVTHVWLLACIAEGALVSYESEAWFLPNCPCPLPCPALFGTTSCTSTGFRTARRAQVLAITYLHLSVLPAKIFPPHLRQVKFVCDSLGMRFTEELNSHNCSFVICATPSGSDAGAALQVAGDKMVQVCQRHVFARLADWLHVTRSRPRGGAYRA